MAILTNSKWSAGQGLYPPTNSVIPPKTITFSKCQILWILYDKINDLHVTFRVTGQCLLLAIFS